MAEFLKFAVTKRKTTDDVYFAVLALLPKSLPNLGGQVHMDTALCNEERFTEDRMAEYNDREIVTVEAMSTKAIKAMLYKLDVSIT